jgi:hypothetical protein
MVDEETLSNLVRQLSEQITPNSERKEYVCYTVIFDNYDKLRGPYCRVKGMDFYCINNDGEKLPPPWKSLAVPREISRDPRANRYFKFYAHKIFSMYKYSLYLDGNITIIVNPLPMLKAALSEHPMACLLHRSRHCAYDEAQELLSRQMDGYVAIEGQMARYRSEGFPEKFGLTHNAVIFRHHQDQRLGRLIDCWWKELVAGSPRDQLCLQYSSWKTGIPIYVIPDQHIMATNKFFWDSIFFYWHHAKKGIGAISEYRRYIASIGRGMSRKKFWLKVIRVLPIRHYWCR